MLLQTWMSMAKSVIVIDTSVVHYTCIFSAWVLSTWCSHFPTGLPLQLWYWLVQNFQCSLDHCFICKYWFSFLVICISTQNHFFFCLSITLYVLAFFSHWPWNCLAFNDLQNSCYSNVWNGIFSVEMNYDKKHFLRIVSEVTSCFSRQKNFSKYLFTI